MKSSEFVRLALAGSPVVLVEYRSFKEEQIRYRDKKTNATIERLIVKHAVEMGGVQMQISEWLPEEAKPGQSVPPYKKGQPAVLEIRGLKQEQGFFKAEGNLYPFDPETQK